METHPTRKPLRLRAYEYASPGAYFVTIVAHRRISLFGRVDEGVMRTNRLGEIVQACWSEVPNHCPSVALDGFVIMPNHIHGILWITVGAGHAPPLPTIVGSFKSAASKEIRRVLPSFIGDVWQRSFYDHVIRSERSLDEIRRYIDDNPRRWDEDPER